MAIEGAANSAGNLSSKAAEAMSQMASRERYWEEAMTEDKIERLRDEVAHLCSMVTQLTQAVVHLSTHQHGSDGKLLTPYVDELTTNRPRLFAHDNGIPHRIRKPHERR